MKTIYVNTSKPYSVLIENGLLSKLGELLTQVSKATKIAIVSDSNVWPLYGEIAKNSLQDFGLECIAPFVIEAGEQSKNSENFIMLLEHLASNHITRSDCVIALGGGVVGDLTGFAAACFLRGIDYIQIPTTLLACVDSSVGGKTAIDLQSGKNLAGAFYQPKLVLCDIDTLDSLPTTVFQDGCAEVIKYGILYDETLFNHLEEYGLKFDREKVISRCIELKRDVVTTDEFDTGARQKLNLGHTIGHGIEAASNFSITHGQAVAAGIAIITRAAVKKGTCHLSHKDRIITLLNKFNLQTNTQISCDVIYQNTLSDKKRSGGKVNLIIPNRIGDCSIVPTNIDKLQEIIQAGL